MKIAFLSSLDLNLYLFRIDIMEKLLEKGHKVYAIIPEGNYSNLIRERGVEVIDYNLSRSSLNPLSAISSILELKSILKSLDLDLLHTFTVKPNIFGTVAGVMAGVPRIYNLVEGLGSFYVDDSFKSRAVKKVIESLYKVSFRFADRVVFVNSDDPKYLVENGILPKNKVKIIRSVGIDTDEYQNSSVSDKEKVALRKDLGLSPDDRVVIMIGRAILHKGTVDFYRAARLLKEKGYKFLFAGGVDEGNKFAMSREFMESGDVIWLDWRDDIKELISISDIVALPSYREGVPRTLLEACSMGKPIVTTDSVGCRESVDDGENGYLIPIKAPEILAQKIDEILSDNQLYEKMSQKSREKAINEFDIKHIVEQYMEIY